VTEFKHRIGFKIKDEASYWFTPLEDITAYEMALLFSMFSHFKPGYSYEYTEGVVREYFLAYPTLERHFERFEKPGEIAPKPDGFLEMIREAFK